MNKETINFALATPIRENKNMDMNYMLGMEKFWLPTMKRERREWRLKVGSLFTRGYKLDNCR